MDFIVKLFSIKAFERRITQMLAII